MSILYENYNINDDASYGLCLGNWYAQTFTVGAAGHLVTSVKLRLFKPAGGNVSPFSVYIRATAASKPTGANLCSGSIDPTGLPGTPGVFIEITLGAGTLVNPATMYAIVAENHASGCAGVNTGWRKKNVGAYGGGGVCWSADSGVTWNTSDPEDFMFEVWGSPLGSKLAVPAMAGKLVSSRII